jgi:hypothetical protein
MPGTSPCSSKDSQRSRFLTCGSPVTPVRNRRRLRSIVGFHCVRVERVLGRRLGRFEPDGMGPVRLALQFAVWERSEVARAAILDAERARRRARLRAEAEELRNDPDDVAASRELAAEMDAIRAW